MQWGQRAVASRSTGARKSGPGVPRRFLGAAALALAVTLAGGARAGTIPGHYIVVLKDGMAIAPESLISFCRDKIAGYKIPRSIEFVDELPRTVTGKVQKNLLRERFPGPVSR